jgi:PilZ domain
MASARAMPERRRSSRLNIHIPVKVLSPTHTVDQHSDERAEAVAVSRTGALLRAPISPELGSRIEVLHGLSEERREFRVVQVSPKPDGLFELGVEMLNPARNFWGVQFPDDHG